MTLTLMAQSRHQHQHCAEFSSSSSFWIWRWCRQRHVLVPAMDVLWSVPLSPCSSSYNTMVFAARSTSTAKAFAGRCLLLWTLDDLFGFLGFDLWRDLNVGIGIFCGHQSIFYMIVIDAGKAQAHRHMSSYHTKSLSYYSLLGDQAKSTAKALYTLHTW